MNAREALNRRLHNHGLSAATRFDAPQQAVAWFGAMQAQDYPQSKWATGSRCKHATDAAIEQAIAERSIVRTWALRGTLQIIAAQDVRWIIQLVGARLIASKAKSDVRRFALDEAAYAEAMRALEGLLHGRLLTRKEAHVALETKGISTAGQRGYHILNHAALLGLICFGPWRGKEDTFVLMDEWLSATRSLTRDKALAEIALRYFRSHGPATVQDFAWWAGLTAGDARLALEGAESQLQQTTINDQTHWMHNESAATRNPSPDVQLLAGFDEYLLGYTDRAYQMQAMHNRRVIHSNGIFHPTVVVDGQIVGTWGRKTVKNKLAITANLFSPLSKRALDKLDDAAARYGEFMGMATQLALQPIPFSLMAGDS
jgi:hypothetical protein